MIRPLGRPGDLGCGVMAHGELYQTEFGWDTSFEALVSRIVADYASAPDPEGRGQGLGGRLVDTCLQFARQAGYERIRLWSNDPLTAARRIYVQRGFVLTAEEPHHSFGVDLIGQTYERELLASQAPEV